MSLSIHFRNGTVTHRPAPAAGGGHGQALTRRLEEAYRWGNARLVRRITALLDLARDIPAATIAQRLCISEPSVYRWLSAFLLDGYTSSVYRRSPGRPATHRPTPAGGGGHGQLTKKQKTRLRQLITAGPDAPAHPACGGDMGKGRLSDGLLESVVDPKSDRTRVWGVV